MADKKASIRLTADARGLDAGLRDARRKMTAFGRGLAKGISFKGIGKGALGGAAGALRGTALGIGGGLGGALGGLKTALGLGGIGGLTVLAGNEARKMVGFERALTRMRIASMGAIRDLSGLRRQTFEVSNATGMAREEVLGGAKAYQTLTGDTATAVGSMELFSRVAQGQGAAMDDVAGAAARIRQNLKIDPKEFEQAFSILIRGGKEGAVELKDMAGLMAGLAPRMARFKGGTGMGALADLGAAFQIAMRGFKDPTEAATGLESLMGSIIQHADKLRKAGVQVYDRDPKTGVKTLRGFREIVEAIGNSKLARDPTLLIKALGRKEAEQTFRMLTEVNDEWREMSSSTRSAKDVQEDYFEYINSTAGRLDKALENVKNTVAQTFTPDRIQAFAQALEAALMMAEDFSAWVEEKAAKPEAKEAEKRKDEASWLWGLVPGAWAAKEMLFHARTEDEETAAAADRFSRAGLTPEQVEERYGKGTPAAELMREREKQKRLEATRKAWAESMGETLDDPANAPRGMIAEDVTPTGWKPPSNADLAPPPTTKVDVDVNLKTSGWFSSIFTAVIENATTRRVRP